MIITTFMSNNINEALTFILPALGKDKFRPNMTHCHIKHSGGDAVFTGMDGYTIKQIKIQTLTTADEPVEYLLPADMVRELIKQTKGKGRVDWTVSLEQHKIQLYNAGDLQAEFGYTVPEDMQYIDINRIFKNINFTNSAEVVAVNAKLMAETLKGFEMPRIKVGGNADPVWITDNEGAFKQAVVMPMRLHDTSVRYYSGESL